MQRRGGGELGGHVGGKILVPCHTTPTNSLSQIKGVLKSSVSKRYPQDQLKLKLYKLLCGCAHAGCGE